MTPSALRADARACHAAALAAVDPERLVAACLRSRAGGLRLFDRAGRRRGEHVGPVLVVGAGKGALAMARAATAAAGVACLGGLVVVPHGTDGDRPAGIEVREASHPLPDAAGEDATVRLLARVAAADGGTLVVVVLSGGASALLVAPTPGVTVVDLRTVTARLLAAGADIRALNAVRKHCSRVAGGNLARAAAGARAVWTLVLSDVVGDDPATIASGPTVADPTTFGDAAAVLDRHLRPGDVPDAVRAHLAAGVAGRAPETAKPGDPVLGRVETVLVGDNRDAVDAAATAARDRGYDTEVVAEPLTGDAAEVGRLVAGRLRAARRDRAVALVAGGETTVRVVAGGRGGRCQHLALAAATVLAGEPCVLLAAGTDGVDGPGGAAGACIDGSTVARAAALGLDPLAMLAATDSQRLLAATGDLLEARPTGTNVADVVVALRAAC